mmetsp:Transcript_92422/g.261095  ORF Transcript_92422/g.261095 Transcript_92422/m.261095 type:complete len:419 (-) Transcript_92422:86-1342(-)
MTAAVVAGSALAIFSFHVASSGFSTLAPFLLPPQRLGWAMSLRGCVACAGFVMAGPWIDSFGSQTILKRGLEMLAIGLVLTAAAPVFESSWLFVLVVVPLGGSSAAIFSAAMAFVADHFTDPLRTQHLGIVIGVGVVGNLAGSPLVSWAFDVASGLNMSLRTAVALAPVLLVALFAYIAMFRIRVEPSVASSLAEDAGEAPVGMTPPCSALWQFCAVYQSMGPQAWLLVTMLMITFGAQSGLLCAISVELKAQDYSASTLAGVIVPSHFVSAVVSPLAGHIAGRPEQRKSSFIWSLSIFGGGLVAAPVATRMFEPTWLPVVYTACMVVSQFASSLLEAPADSAFVDLAAAKSIGNGRATTASEFAVSLGDMVGPYLGSVILRSAGFEAFCCVFGGALVLTAGLVAMLWQSQGEKIKSS